MNPPGLQRSLIALPPTLLLIGSLASADAITGRVVDQNGVGVAGVDIDFVNLGSGGNPHEQNDGTDVNGNFLTTLDPGVYEVRFYPPPPPTTTLLTGVISSVVIVGTKNVGTITLAPGVSTTGTIKNTAGTPVGGVKVDVFNDVTGAQFLMKGNLTSAFGNFNVAVPVNTPLRTEFLTSGVIGQVLVPRVLFGIVTGTTNFGVKTLQPGFHVTGTVHTESGAAISGADTDTIDVLTGLTLFTPSDNTNSAGVFDVVLPAGTFDLVLTRPTGQVLVGTKVKNLVVSAPTNVGILTMRNGVFLSGTVRDRGGVPVLAADVNVYEVSTGLSLELNQDNTNAAGFYSVVVPKVLVDVVFSPPGNPSLLAKDRHNDINITVNTTLDGRFPGAPGHFSQHSDLPPMPASFPFGRGTPGTGGSVPHIRGGLGGASLSLWFSGGRPGAGARLLLGSGEQNLALMPGVSLVNPEVRLPLVLDDTGAAHLNIPLPSTALLGRALHAQLAVFDPEAQHGLAVSHVLALHRLE